MNNSFPLKDKNNISLSNNFNYQKIINFDNKHEIILKSINVCNILKSFICNIYIKNWFYDLIFISTVVIKIN